MKMRTPGKFMVGIGLTAAAAAAAAMTPVVKNMVSNRNSNKMS